jgi:hypothetical protein
MGHRKDNIVARTYAEYMYRNGIKMKISEEITKCIQIIVVSLTRKRWECPIGHIVPRTPIWTTEGNSSDLALSVYIKQSKVWCMVPFGKDLFSRVKGLGKDEDVYINSLEYIALQLASIIVNELYDENPTAFPPSPALSIGRQYAVLVVVRPPQYDLSNGTKSNPIICRIFD